MRIAIVAGSLLVASAGALAQAPAPPSPAAPAAACDARPARACVLALAIEAAREIRDPNARSVIAHRIADLQARAGAAEAARQTLALFGQAPPREAAASPEAVVMNHLAAGDAPAALAAAEALTDPEQRDGMLLAIAMTHAEAGRVAEGDAALARLSGTADPEQRAVALAMLGHAEAALAAAAQIPDEGARMGALQHVARIHAEAGRRDAARAAALAIASLPGRAAALAEAAEALRDPALVEEAAAVMRRAPNEDAGFLDEYRVRVLAASGRIAEAAQRARGLPDPVVRARTLAELARTTGDPAVIAEAQPAARALRDALARESALRDVAVGLAKAGRRDEATALAGSLGPGMRDWTLLALAREINRQDARATLALARTIRDAIPRATTLVDLAQALPD